MSKIFISYRRSDSADAMGRIFDHLAPAIGRENIFKDVDSIALGIDFRQAIARAVQACDITSKLGRQISEVEHLRTWCSEPKMLQKVPPAFACG